MTLTLLNIETYHSQNSKHFNVIICVFNVDTMFLYEFLLGFFALFYKLNYFVATK